MSNDMPEVIYAASYKLRNDSGIWFDKKINHVAMPTAKYYSESHIQQLIKEAEERQKRIDAVRGRIAQLEGKMVDIEILNAGGE